jgi:hypothetical protein
LYKYPSPPIRPRFENKVTSQILTISLFSSLPSRTSHLLLSFFIPFLSYFCCCSSINYNSDWFSHQILHFYSNEENRIKEINGSFHGIVPEFHILKPVDIHKSLQGNRFQDRDSSSRYTEYKSQFLITTHRPIYELLTQHRTDGEKLTAFTV